MPKSVRLSKFAAGALQITLSATVNILAKKKKAHLVQKRRCLAGLPVESVRRSGTAARGETRATDAERRSRSRGEAKR